MNDARILLQDSLEKIYRAMQEGKWSEAYEACLEILRYDAENHEALHLKTKIEQEVKKANRQAIKTTLSQLEQLWREKKYRELVTELKRLEPFFAEYPALQKWSFKAQKAYQQGIFEERQNAYQTAYHDLKNLAQHQEYAKALKELQELRIPGFRDPKLERMERKLRKDWLQSEINKNQILLKSDRYEEILFFLQGLQHIDPESKTLQRWIKRTKKLYQILKQESKKEFIYQSTEQIRTLYQIKKFDKVVLAAYEVLDIAPNNREIRSFLKKAQRKVHQQIDREVINQMLSAQKKYRNDLQNTPGDLKKIDGLF